MDNVDALRSIADEFDRQAHAIGQIAPGEQSPEAIVCRNVADKVDQLVSRCHDFAEENNDLRAERERLRALLEDAVDTLEAMNLHTNNPLYDRLRAALENTLPPWKE